MEDKNIKNEAVALNVAHTEAMEALSNIKLPEGATMLAFIVTPIEGEDNHYFGAKIDGKASLINQGFHNLFEQQPALLLPVSVAVDNAMDPIKVLANLFKK